MKGIRPIITIKVLDKNGQISTCNIVEKPTDTFEHLAGRINDLEEKGFQQVGDATIQYVLID